MPKQSPITITIPFRAIGAVQVVVINPPSDHETPAGIEPVAQAEGANGASSIAPSANNGQDVGASILAADPACRCRVSTPAAPARIVSWSSLRFAMKWTQRAAAVFQTCSAIRDTAFPVAMAAAAAYLVV
jgi:hypothetical protein